MAGLHVRSSAEVPATVDMAALVLRAGGKLEHARYDNGVLMLRGVEQADLDAAVAEGFDEAYALRRTKLDVLDAQLEAKRAQGMPWLTKTVQLHEEALSDINRVVTAHMAGAFPSPFAWRMMDNTFVAMDGSDVVAMASAVMAYMNALLMHYWQVKDAILAASDELALNTIDVATGWPAPTTT